MKTAIIFDFGGVLMRTMDYSHRHAWDDRLGLPHGSVERAVHNGESWRQAQCGSIPLSDYWGDVARRLGLSAPQVKQLAADFYRGDQLDPALIGYIRTLRDAGHPVALLSNHSIDLADELVHLGIAELFDPLVVSAQIGVMKPDPHAYQIVLDGLGYPPQKTVFVDDRLDNVQAAQAIGMHAVHFRPEIDLPAELAKFL